MGFRHSYPPLSGSFRSFKAFLGGERTEAGIAAAKAAGKHMGRKPTLTADQINHGKELRGQGKSGTEIAQLLGVARSTVYKHLKD